VNIYDPYPDTIELDGKTVRLNLAYDRVLRALDVAEMQDLTDADKLELQCALLLADEEPVPADWREQARILQAVAGLMPKNNNPQGSRSIDFHQDAALIRSAFFRIGIDLTREKIHFLQFLELLADLPADTALMRVVDIRQRPVPAANKHNREQIAALIKAKQRVAIKLTEEEQRKCFAESLKNSTIIRG
jgi:hypothetical protein